MGCDNSKFQPSYKSLGPEVMEALHMEETLKRSCSTAHVHSNALTNSDVFSLSTILAPPPLQRQVICLVEHSTAMQFDFRWQVLRSVLLNISGLVVGTTSSDPFNLPPSSSTKSTTQRKLRAAFFNDANSELLSFPSEKMLESDLLQIAPSGGSLGLEPALVSAISHHFHHSHGLTVICVFVSNALATGTAKMIQLLKDAGEALEHSHQLSIVFVQIGDQTDCTKSLCDLQAKCRVLNEVKPRKANPTSSFGGGHFPFVEVVTSRTIGWVPVDEFVRRRIWSSTR